MRKNILIVDDSSIMRKMIKQTLLKAGHHIVGEAKSGIDAVQMYKMLSPDLVTMDITMRGMDGIAAARQIIDGDDQAKIIILSNLDEDKYNKEASEIGVKGYISKHKTRQILELIDSL